MRPGLALAFALVACGANVSTTPQGRDDDAAADVKDVGPTCPVLPGTAAELASTPRADQNLELLALATWPEDVIASQVHYDRIVADVHAARKLDAAIAGAGYFPRGDGRVWQIDAADVATADRMSSGSYDAWDCLNTHFGKVRLTRIGSTSTTFRLELEGRYQNEIVRALYAALPSVTSVYFGGPGSGPTICATDEGTRMVYAIDQASGDCPAGCTTHDWWLVTSTAPGVVSLAGHHPDGGGPAPDWLTRYGYGAGTSCR